MMTLFEIRNALADGTSIYELPLKVTYYARVSTDKYEQLNSLENQVTYYENYIKENCKNCNCKKLFKINSKSSAYIFSRININFKVIIFTSMFNKG